MKQTKHFLFTENNQVSKMSKKKKQDSDQRYNFNFEQSFERKIL